MMLVKSVNSWLTLRITAPKLLHRAEKMDCVKQQNAEVVEKHSCQKKQEKAKQNIAQVYVITTIKQRFQKLEMNVNLIKIDELAALNVTLQRLIEGKQ